MTSSFLFSRNDRRSLLIEFNPFQILVAGLRRPDAGPVVLDWAVEFAADDNLGLGAWLDEKLGEHRTPVPASCGFVTPEGLLHRESLPPRKLAEPGYLATLAREQFKIGQPEAWILRTLNPQEGLPFTPDGVARSALFFGVSYTDLRRVQQRLLDQRLLSGQLEMGILPLIGAITGYTAWRSDKRAVVVVVIHEDHTVAYILGKEGLHTPAPVRHGFSSIVQAVRKEFRLSDAAGVRDRLNHPDDDLLLRGTRFVRAIGHDLKPVVDSYEMKTGQPVGEIYCAYLPPGLAWIAEPLAQVIQRTSFAVDCPAWLATVGLQAGGDLPALGPHWLGALGLVAVPQGPPGGKSPEAAAWHVDCRLANELPGKKPLGRRFLAAVIAATVTVFALTLALWQWYVIRSLDADTLFWNQQMAANQRLFDELARSTSALGTQSHRFDHAFELMNMPYPVTDFILSLGRSLPPRMRVNLIEASGNRVTMSGSLREPPEQSSRTLGRYLESLRHAPDIGPLFSSIGLTALQREGEKDESLIFEITFKRKEPPP
jgi:hypothetical protein